MMALSSKRLLVACFPILLSKINAGRGMKRAKALEKV